MFEIGPHCSYVDANHLKERLNIFFLFFCISGVASFQQGFSREEQPDHVFAEDVAASDSSDEPSLRPFQALQRQNSDEVRPEDEENIYWPFKLDLDSGKRFDGSSVSKDLFPFSLSFDWIEWWGAVDSELKGGCYNLLIFFHLLRST